MEAPVMTCSRIPSLGLAPVLALGVAECDAHTDDRYLGEPLVSVHGKVANQRSETPPEVNLYQLWADLRPGAPVFIAETLQLRPTFPVTFTLDVFTPPPV